jgi:hypothetical protein
MPHRFEVEALAEVNPFSPSLRHWRVTAAVRVPVIWAAVNGRATVPPDRDNLHEFRKLIESNARYAPARRMRLAGWTVTPDDYAGVPPRGEPDPDWTVHVVLDVL